MANILKLSILFFCSCFLFTACSKPSSASKITDISDVKAEIDIYQSLSDENDNSVSVILYDKKNKQFGNDSVIVTVNGKKAEYKVMQHLYYSKYYDYRAEDVQPKNNSYELYIQLSNGKKFFLASIPSLKTSSSANIIYSKEAALNQDYSLRWSDLHDVNILYFSKTVRVKTKEEKEGGSNVQTFIEQPEDTIKINPDGNYTVKKETFFKPGEKMSALSFKFTAEKTGTVNPRLLKGSSIRIRGSHEERVSFR